MDLANKIEECNWVVEKNREDFLSKHLKTVVAAKWAVENPNGGWARILGGSANPDNHYQRDQEQRNEGKLE